MAAITGRTRMSSRGQIVIPKALRDAAGLVEGDDVEVAFDGQRLILAPLGRGERPSVTGDGLVRETGSGYEVTGGIPSGKVPDADRPSKIWADRVRAVANIKRLREASYVPDLKEILAESRRQLRGSDDHE